MWMEQKNSLLYSSSMEYRISAELCGRPALKICSWALQQRGSEKEPGTQMSHSHPWRLKWHLVCSKKYSMHFLNLVFRFTYEKQMYQSLVLCKTWLEFLPKVGRWEFPVLICKRIEQKTRSYIYTNKCVYIAHICCQNCKGRARVKDFNIAYFRQYKTIVRAVWRAKGVCWRLASFTIYEGFIRHHIMHCIWMFYQGHICQINTWVINERFLA